MPERLAGTRAWIACARLCCVASCSADGCDARARLAEDAPRIRAARAKATGNVGSWSRHELVAEQDFPAIDSKCLTMGLEASFHPPTTLELEAAFRSAKPALRRCLQAAGVPPQKIDANVHGATGSIAGAMVAEGERAGPTGSAIDDCLRASLSTLCVLPFATAPGYPYIAWTFDELAESERARSVYAAAAALDDPLRDIDSSELKPTGDRNDASSLEDEPRNDWCGTGTLEARRREERKAQFFASARWTPTPVPEGCKGLPRRATLETVAPGMIPAEAALEECRRIDGLIGELPIAFEIGTTGWVTAALARTEVPNKELDACVARALSRALFEPRAEPEQRLWYVRGRDPALRVTERLALPLELTAVRSACPEQRAAAAALPTRDDLADVNERMRGAMHRCMKREGFDDYSLTVVFNVHAATGRIVGAGAAAEPRSRKLDACVAQAAANVCFLPFVAERSTEPYHSFRSTFSSGQPEHLVEVASKCGPAKPWGKARSAQEEINTLVRPALPAIRRCFTSHGFSMSEPRWVDVEIESETGGIVAVAADLAPRRRAVDACIAKTLTRVCVQQFRPIGDSSRARSRHAFIVDASR